MLPSQGPVGTQKGTGFHESMESGWPFEDAFQQGKVRQLKEENGWVRGDNNPKDKDSQTKKTSTAIGRLEKIGANTRWLGSYSAPVFKGKNNSRTLWGRQGNRKHGKRGGELREEKFNNQEQSK